MTQTAPFNEQVAIELVQAESSNPFPVSIEDMIIWLGGSITSSAKTHARKVLEDGGYVEEEDFVVKTSPCLNSVSQGFGGRPATNNIYLNVRTAAHYAMMSKRPNGRKVRNMFYDAMDELSNIKHSALTQQTNSLAKDGMVIEALAGILENINTQNALMAQEFEKNSLLIAENKQRLDKTEETIDKARKTYVEVNTKVTSHEEKLNQLIPPEGFSTVAGYIGGSKAHNYSVPRNHTKVNQIIGKEASTISKELSIPIYKIQSPNYSTGIGAYKVNVIKLAIASAIKNGKLLAVQKRIRIHLTLPNV